MRLNKMQIEWMIENDLLLREATNTDGSLSKIFAPVKKELAQFGEVATAAVKLVTVDVMYLLKLTVGSWLPNRDKLKELKREKNQTRNKLLSTIEKGLDFEDSPGMEMMFMLAPGAFLAGKGLKTVATPFTAESRDAIGELGFKNIPGFGPLLFDPDTTGRDGLWAEISKQKDAEGVFKLFTDKLDKITGGKGTEDKTTIMGIPKTALALSGLFLLGKYGIKKEWIEQEGSLLVEGEDDGYEPTEEDIKRAMDAIEKLVNEKIQVPVDKVLKMKEKELKKYFGDTPKAVELVATLTGADDLELFVNTLSKLSKAMDADSSKFSIEKIEGAIKDSRENIRNDEEAMEKFKKQFEEAKEEPTEDELSKRIDNVILSGFKSQFLQEIKGAFQDLLEKSEAEIWDGMTKKQKDVLKTTKAGQAYHELCKKYEDQISDALSKLAQT